MIVVMGYGRSGQAVAGQLSRLGMKGCVTDSRPLQDAPRFPGIHYVLGEHPLNILDQASWVVVSPGVPWDHPFLEEARRRGIATASDVEWAGLQVKGRKIGVTGSNGKSTVTRMLAAILKLAGLKAEEAANMGAPLAAFLAGPVQDWYVLELSSFQLEGMQLPILDAAVLLNITPDHLDRHPSFEYYAGLKKHIFDLLLAGGRAVAPSGLDPGIPALRFGRDDQLDLRITDGGLFYQGRSVLSRAAFPLRGDHNWENAAAAALTALPLGICADTVRKALETFTGLEHRMEVVPSRDGATYINDSKGTNVDSVLAALTGVPEGRTVLILGGKDKGGDFTPLKDPVGRMCKIIFCIGQAGDTIIRQLKGLCVPIHRAQGLPDVFKALQEVVQPGDCVLLSPGCASFDQYRNFEERGRHFKDLVKACQEN